MLIVKLTELIEEYESGALSKAEFITRANDVHSILFSYPDVLRQSSVDQILIDDQKVTFHVGGEDLWLSCPAGESRVAPIEMLNFRAYEASETKVMLAMLEHATVIFDIGANIGWYSLLFARRFPAAIVHAFEPLQYFSDHLVDNVHANKLDQRIVVHRFGFSDEDSVVEVHMARGNATNASLRNVADAVVDRIPVTVKALDSWCDAAGVVPDFIKCDVEGAELLVLRGGERLLSEHPPVLFLELLRKWTRPYGYHPNDLIGHLAKHGYECFGIGASAIEPIPAVDESTVQTNYLFLHRVEHRSLAASLGVGSA